MKKTIRILLACILALGACFAAVGCDDKTETSTPKDVTLVNFENYAPDFSLCRIFDNFGKVSVNTDEKYVKSGTRSARIDPVGHGWMYFPTYSEYHNFDYTDFSYVRSVRLEMYNPQESDEIVRVGLISAIHNINEFDKVAEEEFTLKSGWNTIDYYVDAGMVAITADIEDIQGVCLSFSACDTYYITETSPRFYLDEVKLIKSDTPHSKESIAEFGENEIIDFERYYHESFIVNELDIEMGIVKAADYGISATSGNKVLRMVIPGNTDQGWKYYFQIMAPYIKLSPLSKLTDEQFEKGYFCWDTYNNASTEFNCVGIFFLGTSNTNYQVASYPKVGEWSTHRIKLTDIEAHLPGWRNNLGRFLFSIKNSFSTEREVFFDNFRIEYSE